MMLAKLSGKGSSTATSAVINADSISGARTSATSRTRRSAQASKTVMAATAPSAARVNASMIVSAVATIVTAEPPASGATRSTSSTNGRSPSCPLRAVICTRTRPSAVRHSSAISAGTSAAVTSPAPSPARNRLS